MMLHEGAILLHTNIFFLFSCVAYPCDGFVHLKRDLNATFVFAIVFVHNDLLSLLQSNQTTNIILQKSKLALVLDVFEVSSNSPVC